LVLLLLALVAAPWVASGEDAGPLLRGPFVSVDGKATTVDVVVDGAQSVKLLASWGGKTVSAPFETVAGKRMRARLELPAASVVDYDVVAASGSLAHGRLDTLPERGSKELHFCAIGDSGWPRKGDGLATNDQLAIARLLEEQHPSLVVHVGDIVYLVGQPKSFDALFFRPYAATLARVPFLMTLGNHDVMTKNGAPTLDDFPYPQNQNGNRFYSFDAANVHFTCLDSNGVLEAGTESAFKETPQGKWLEQDLAGTSADWKIVFCHHPMYSCTKNHKRDLAIMQASLDRILDEAGVDFVLTGHDHYYHRSVRMRGGKADERGIVHLITGGGGAPLTQGEPQNGSLTAAFASRYHMTRFDVSGRSMHIQALGLSPDGKTECFDDATITTRKVR
jgi:predicted phosphodiesterase